MNIVCPRCELVMAGTVLSSRRLHLLSIHSELILPANDWLFCRNGSDGTWVCRVICHWCSSEVRFTWNGREGGEVEADSAPQAHRLPRRRIYVDKRV